MRVLMLGWEYPPHITGGLGTACEGLTKGLSKRGIGIDFIVPHLTGDERASHMTLHEPPHQVWTSVSGNPSMSSISLDENAVSRGTTEKSSIPDSLTTHRIPSSLSPYLTESTYHSALRSLGSNEYSSLLSLLDNLPNPLHELLFYEGWRKGAPGTYGADIFSEVARFTAEVVRFAHTLTFDVIHAHDWMTFPAGVALSRITGKKLVVHIHSLEFDRSGQAKNTRIHDLEHMGIHYASKVVAVSYYTASLIEREHGISSDRIQVVHNGVYSQEAVISYKNDFPHSKLVLFLGRVTFQKGPDYFVEAAARVVPHVPEAVFVMAGSGDMLPRMVERVHDLGLERHFHFSGFLRGHEVEKMFSLADLYVMPSVSEPFGISALEAIKYDTPVIISRQSGASEVLSHALKVDFWDIEKMSDLIINALLHKELREDMVNMARHEVKALQWDAAAEKVDTLYQSLA
jgi:glycogen synthase